VLLGSHRLAPANRRRVRADDAKRRRRVARRRAVTRPVANSSIARRAETVDDEQPKLCLGALEDRRDGCGVGILPENVKGAGDPREDVPGLLGLTRVVALEQVRRTLNGLLQRPQPLRAVFSHHASGPLAEVERR
jgi:hypothetical protein